jgi:hypothetical protein
VNRAISFLVVLGAWVLASMSAIAQADPNAGLILPGVSVMGLKLGGAPSAFQAVFSKRSGSANSAQSGTVGEGCPDTVYYWNDLEVDTSKVDAYFKNGEVSQISAYGPKFSLSNGLRTGSAEQSVERAYPRGLMHVLLYSGGKVNGGRDVHYWVDKEAGIAFELDWWQSKKQRFVGSIDIFPKGSGFRPDGCISTPQEWKQLK